jgi:hypothetical protein
VDDGTTCGGTLAQEVPGVLLMCGICGGLMYLIPNGLRNVMLAIAPTVEIPGFVQPPRRWWAHRRACSASTWRARTSRRRRRCSSSSADCVKMWTFAYAYVLIALVAMWGKPTGTRHARGGAIKYSS